VFQILALFQQMWRGLGPLEVTPERVDILGNSGGVMNDQELKEFRESQYNCSRPDSWVWDEEQVCWRAPNDPPQDGLPYIWDETEKKWVLFPGYPTEITNEDK
jgi:hypothetical protein